MSTLDKPKVTAESIVATAQRLGIRLTRRVWYSPFGPCGCAGGVAVLALRGDTEAPKESFWFEKIQEFGLPFDVARGLSNGFEGLGPHAPPDDDGTYAAAYRVGHAVAVYVSLDVPELTEAQA